MGSEELLRSVVLAAAGLVVASAYGFVQRVSGFIDIKGEAALPSTVSLASAPSDGDMDLMRAVISR